MIHIVEQIAYVVVKCFACYSCTERSSCSVVGNNEVGWLDSRCPHVIELHPSEIHVDLLSNTSVCLCCYAVVVVLAVVETNNIMQR